MIIASIACVSPAEWVYALFVTAFVERHETEPFRMEVQVDLAGRTITVLGDMQLGNIL